MGWDCISIREGDLQAIGKGMGFESLGDLKIECCADLVMDQCFRMSEIGTEGVAAEGGCVETPDVGHTFVVVHPQFGSVCSVTGV